jgi:hypothetical protein
LQLSIVHINTVNHHRLPVFESHEHTLFDTTDATCTLNPVSTALIQQHYHPKCGMYQARNVLCYNYHQQMTPKFATQMHRCQLSQREHHQL